MPPPTAAPWLDDILADVGTKEFAGKAANPKIQAYFAEVGHPECKSDEIAWCAARCGAALKRAGQPIPPVNVNLMARSYLTWGVACEPKRGAIVVFPRGNSTWQGHVGCVVEVAGDKVKFVAGNQSDAVGYGTARIDSALGFRWPVAATIPALREAGSTDIKKGDAIQNVGTAAGIGTVGLSAVESMLGPATVPDFKSLPEGLSWWQSVISGFQAIGKLFLDHPWLAGLLVVAIGLAALGHWVKKARVARHAAGLPIASQVAKLEAA